MGELPLLQESPWDDPEARRDLLLASLERWDRATLAEGYRRYLNETRGKVDPYKVFLLENFLYWLKSQGRRWPRLKAGDVREFLALIKEKGPPLARGPRRGHSDAVVARAHTAIRHFVDFLTWAGLGWPEHVELPPRPLPFGEQKALSEDEYRRLLKAVEDDPLARHRDLMRAIVTLVGERGFRLGELIDARLEDYDARKGVLHVRYPLPREVPLTPEARDALEQWLLVREAIAGRLPHPPVRLFLRTSPQGYGQPLSHDFLKIRLARLFDRAGIAVEGGHRMRVHRLRWRAVRKLRQEGYDKHAIAKLLGQANIELL